MQLRASREENELEWLGEFGRRWGSWHSESDLRVHEQKKVEYPTFSAVGPKDVSKKRKRKHKVEKFLNNWDGGSIQRWVLGDFCNYLFF